MLPQKRGQISAGLIQEVYTANNVVDGNEKYEFNPDTGNIVRVDFPPVEAAYVKLIFTSNSSTRTAGAQAAEILVFEP